MPAKGTLTPSEKRKAYMKVYRSSYNKPRPGLTLSESEHALFSKLAKREGVGVATIIKRMALAYHQSDSLMSAELEQELKSLNLLVRNVANNINQIAHKSNMGSQIDINEVLGYLRTLSDQVTDHTQSKLKNGHDY